MEAGYLLHSGLVAEAVINGYQDEKGISQFRNTSRIINSEIIETTSSQICVSNQLPGALE
jgi:hypothetical protein